MPLLSYILDISRLGSSAILDSYTIVPLYSNLYYYPIFPTRIFLSVLETYANTFFKLYTIRTY